jgi:hypothetical protein
VLEAGCASPDAAVAIARDGLAFCYEEFTFKRGGESKTLKAMLDEGWIDTLAQPVATEEIKGSATFEGISVPVDGKDLDEAGQKAQAQVCSQAIHIEHRSRIDHASTPLC